MNGLRLELANEEATASETGNAQPHEISPSAFVQMGLDLEEQQYVFENVLWFILAHHIIRKAGSRT